MPQFFEQDRDEIVFRDTTYLDYFNLYPNLWFQPTLDHLKVLDAVDVIDSEENSEGWQIAVRFCGHSFLLDTHYHGTSTLFCADKRLKDETIMLAFLGCFLTLLRDDWFPQKGAATKPKWL